MVCRTYKKLKKKIKFIDLGNGAPRDRTNQIIEFKYIYPSVFISISICSAIGLIISILLFVFNIHFQSHR
jgi:hypothetical protein